MLRLRHLVSTGVTCGLLLLATAPGEATATDNAALAYWQAFAQLPSVNEELEKLLTEAPSVKLDQRTKTLIKKSEGALTSMQRAAAVPECDWGLEFSAGPHMVMPHLSKARQLARYACLHARQQIADGQTDQALESIRDALMLARHVGADDVLIAVLVQYAVEQIVVETVSQELPKFDRKHLDTLAGYLDSLPKGGSISKSLGVEQRVYVDWARRVVGETKTDEEASQWLRSMVAMADQADDVVTVTKKQISIWLDETEKDYDQMHAILDLPSDEFQRKWDVLLKRSRAGNPYSKLVLPSLKSLREVRDNNAVMWALLRAAILVQRDGDKQLATIKDPTSGQPFEYAKLPTGFRLRSQFSYRGNQAELTVGPAASE